MMRNPPITYLPIAQRVLDKEKNVPSSGGPWKEYLEGKDCPIIYSEGKHGTTLRIGNFW